MKVCVCGNECICIGYIDGDWIHGEEQKSGIE